MKKLITLIATLTFFAGCAAPVGSIVKRDDGTYQLYKEDRAGMFGSFDGLKKNVNQEIDEFAKKEGKQVVRISEQEHPGSLAYADWSKYLVVFNLKDPGQDRKIIKEHEQYLNCVKNLSSDPSLNAISSKVPFGDIKQQSFMMLANNEKPTEQEKLAIAAYGERNKQCQNYLDLYLNSSGAPSEYVALTRTTNATKDELLVDLYNGKITYGEYSSLLQKLGGNYDAAVAQIERSLKANAADAKARDAIIANQSAIANAQMRQANAANMAASAALLQATKPVYNAPTQIISRPNQSRSINCTSRSGFGSTVNTTCN